MELTIGYVAGIIAAGVFLARIWAPNVITLVVSALLQDRASASTWSVAARAFYRSQWPELLQSDSVLNRGVRKDVLWLTKLMGLFGIVIGIAGIVTPLGLYQALLAGQNIQVPFKYLTDSSSFGFGTPPRSNLPFSRQCSQGIALRAFSKPCPYTEQQDVVIVTNFPNGTTNYNWPNGLSMKIPEILVKAYSSGTVQGTTVSNFFDIQWRRYVTTSKEIFNNGTDYLVGNYRSIETLIMNNKYEAVEGLVVDLKTGGVGLRNHTAPPGFAHGVTWDEDLLFLEPESVCVDTNLTIDFTISAANNSVVNEVVLTDRGGFANINTTYPKIVFNDTQKDPELYRRAQKAAWLQNVYTMLYFNITNPSDSKTKTGAFSYLNSHINKTFSLMLVSKSLVKGFDSLGISNDFGGYLSNGQMSPFGGSVTNSSAPLANVNPFHINADNFSTIKLLCTGAGNSDFANISNILVNCGFMTGVPQRMSPGSNLVFDKGSIWSQKMFTCASSVKATVKTVSFNYNGTQSSLKSLTVVDIRPKAYKDEISMPLWGVENTGNAWTSEGINLIWGLLSPEYANRRNISTVRQPSLFLPGWMDPLVHSRYPNDGVQNLPAIDAPVGGMTYAYCVGGSGSFTNNIACGADSDSTEYSGSNNIAMWLRWQSLTKNAESASLIPNLIWTDFMASAIVGTKGVLGPGNIAQKNIMPLPVTPTVLKIRYHYYYAVPAALALLSLVLITIMALAVTCFYGVGIARMRNHMRQISPGRIYTSFMFPSPDGMSLRSREWGQSLGRNQIDFSHDYPMTAMPPMKGPNKDDHVNVYERSVVDDVSAHEGLILPLQQSQGHVIDETQGDIGYGFTQPQQYHNQYLKVSSYEPHGGASRYS